jgi:hypothetical protein
MFLIAAAVLFSVFLLNVVIGSTGSNPFLSDVGEMLILFAASLAFVAAILKREAAKKQNTE